MYAKVCFGLVAIALRASIAFGSPADKFLEAMNTEAAARSGLVQLANTGYSVGFTQVNYFQAFLNCRQNNLFLVSIETPEEQAALEELIQEYGMESYNFWTSGADFAYDGLFFWTSTEQPLTYDNFKAGEPNSQGDEHCIEIRGGTYGFTWNDKSCSVKDFYICEAL